MVIQNKANMFQIVLTSFWPILKISWKSFNPFLCDVANRHKFPWQIMKQILYPEGDLEHA